MKAPAFQFYPKQWLGDDMVLLMSWDARAMHMHFMCIAWQQSPPCTLPDDDEMLRQWVGNPRNWEILKKQIFRAWRLDGGRWVQGGLLAEWNKQQSYRESRKSGSEARWKKNAYALHMECITDALLSSSSSSTTEEPPIVPQGGPVAVPTRKPKLQMTAEQRGWFDEWWNIYPRHVAKLEAEKAWGRHVRDRATADAALAGLNAQLPDFASRERDKIPHPATWINQHRWTDEPEKQKNLPHPYPVGGVPQNVRNVRSWRGEAMSDLFYPEESRV